MLLWVLIIISCVFKFCRYLIFYDKYCFKLFMSRYKVGINEVLVIRPSTYSKSVTVEMFRESLCMLVREI
jgi:hypothetical protein